MRLMYRLLNEKVKTEKEMQSDELKVESLLTWLKFRVGEDNSTFGFNKRLREFNALRRELSPKATDFIHDDLVTMSGLENECIFCLSDTDQLLATAQMSIMFPGM